MTAYRQLIEENRLIKLGVTWGWHIHKNNLFNVSLDWLNALQQKDPDEFFMLKETSFCYQTFNTSFINHMVLSRYNKVNLYVTSCPTFEEEKITDLTFDIDLVLESKKNHKYFCKNFQNLDEVSNALNRLMAIISLDSEEILGHSNFTKIEMILDEEIIAE